MTMKIKELKKEYRPNLISLTQAQKELEADEEWEKIDQYARERAEKLAKMLINLTDLKVEGSDVALELLRVVIHDYICDVGYHEIGEDAYSVIREVDEINNLTDEVQKMKKEHTKKFN